MCILCETASAGVNEVVKVIEPVAEVSEPIKNEVSSGLGEIAVEQGSQNIIAYSGSMLGLVQGFLFATLAIVSIGAIFILTHSILEYKNKN